MKAKNKTLKKYILIYLIIEVISLILTYLVFTIKGDIPVGIDLQKNDWLSFWAGFLSFLGSIFLGLVAIWQNSKANEMNEKLINKELNSIIVGYCR